MAALFNIQGLASSGEVELRATVLNLDRAEAAIRELGADFVREMGGAMFRELETNVIGPAKEIVPLDTGNLSNTGHVDLPVEDGGDVVVTAGFGGPAEPYALEQHERLDFAHPNGRQAKYLETPFLQALPSMDERMAEDVRQHLGVTQ